MATLEKLNALVAKGMGNPVTTSKHIHIHNSDLFKHNQHPKCLVLVEANALGIYRYPPCKWVARHMPDLAMAYRSLCKESQTREARSAMLGSINCLAQYRDKGTIAHAVLSYGFAKSPDGRIVNRYVPEAVRSAFKEAASLALSYGLDAIYVTRICGGMGGALFSDVVRDVEIGLGDSKIDVHFFVPKDPDQSLILAN